MKTKKTITKNKFRELAKKRGFIVSYSGKKSKFFIKKSPYFNINKCINAKSN